MGEVEGVRKLIQEGIGWINVNDLPRAYESLTGALSISPLHPDVNHLLAVVLLRQNGDLDLAISHIEVAISVAPDQPLFHNSLGTALWQAGRFEESRKSFETVVARKPDYIEAQYNLANCYRSLGDAEKAVEQYEKVIDLQPEFSDAHNDLGIVYQDLGMIADAKEQFEMALELDPGRFEYYVNLAQSQHAANELDAALISIQNAISLSPDNGKLLNNLGTIYLDQGNRQEAMRAFSSAKFLIPDDPVPKYNLGYTQHVDGDFSSATRSFDSALELRPEWPGAWVNRSNSQFMLQEYDEAIIGYEKALQLAPETVIAHKNLGSTYRRLGLDQKAKSHFKQALILEPDHAKSHLGLAMVYLKEGRFQRAWRHYEWRFEATNSDYVQEFSLRQPLWSGEMVTGKTILIISEQGAGDLIHFIRYTARVRALGAKLLLVCAPGLKRLMERSGEFEEVYDRTQIWPTEFDFYLPLLSLPKIFDTAIDTIPCEIPYLKVDPQNVIRWKSKLDRSTINVGLAWSGNPDQVENQFRSCSILDLEPFLKLDGYTFYSLQKGEAAGEIGLISKRLPLIDLTDEIDDFSDTVDLMQALDLVISVDTSTAHLAGALGKPVWTMLWYAHCWRYLRDQSDSPWYPSMRLFRQSESGDWSSVIAEITGELIATTRRTPGSVEVGF